MKKRKIKLCYFRRSLSPGVSPGLAAGRTGGVTLPGVAMSLPSSACPPPEQGQAAQLCSRALRDLDGRKSNEWSCAPQWQSWTPVWTHSGSPAATATPRQPLDTPARKEQEQWVEDEHSPKLNHLPCPVLLLLAGIQMNKKALPQA